jgi:hypothetical protein
MRATLVALRAGLVFSALTLGAPPTQAGGYEDEMARMMRNMPKDVRQLIERRTGCNHWSGEEAYDAARGEEINTAVRHLKCDRLDRDEKRLKHLYRGRPDVLSSLKQADDWF